MVNQDQKVKNYPFWRFKIKLIGLLLKNGGWHFSYVMRIKMIKILK